MEWGVLIVLILGYFVYSSAKKQEAAQARRFDAAHFEIELFQDEDGSGYFRFDLNMMRMQYVASSVIAACRTCDDFVIRRDADAHWWRIRTQETFERHLREQRELAAENLVASRRAAERVAEMERDGNQWEAFQFEHEATIEAHFHRHMRGG